MYHFQKSVNDWPRAVAALPPGSLIKVVDRGDILRDARAANPDVITTLRHWGVGQHFGGTLEDNKNAARHFFSTFIDGTFRDQYAQYTDVVQGFNEYLASSHTGAELDARLTWAEAVANVWTNEYRTKPEYSHIRLALVNCPIGNDIDRRFAEIAIEYDCILSYHAYSHYIDGQRDPGDWRYHSGRWNFMEQSWGLRPDWLFGEAGPYASVWDGWRSSKCQGGNVAAYVEAVRAFIRDVQTTDAYKQGRLYGFALFTTGGGDMWSAYETAQPELDALAAMIAEEWHPGSEPVPPPPPPPDDGVPYKVIVDLLPQDATGIEKVQVVDVVHDSRETVLQSADDAARLVAPGKEGSRVKAWWPERWGDGDIAAWLQERGVALVETWPLQSVAHLHLGLPISGVQGEDWVILDGGRFNAPRDYPFTDGPDLHEGLDFSARKGGLRVLCCKAGVVDKVAFSEQGYGHYCRVRHEAPVPCWTIYGHMATEPTVAVGQPVYRGQDLGPVGSSGGSSGAHVHLTVRLESGGLSGYVIPGVIDPEPHLDW